MQDDRTILIDALSVAARAYYERHPHRTLIGPDPEKSVLDQLSVAIDECGAYQAVAGHMLFSGGVGPVLHASMLAVRLFR
jgi:hypothetical protein